MTESIINMRHVLGFWHDVTPRSYIRHNHFGTQGVRCAFPDLVVLHEANMAKAAAIIILIFFISIIINQLFDEYVNLSMRNRA